MSNERAMEAARRTANAILSEPRPRTGAMKSWWEAAQLVARALLSSPGGDGMRKALEAFVGYFERLNGMSTDQLLIGDGTDEKTLLANGRAALDASPPLDPWRKIETAPKDGTPILILFRHKNYQYATTAEERARWEEACIARWIDHNGGGWTWHGIAGDALMWHPVPTPPSVDGRQAGTEEKS